MHATCNQANRVMLSVLEHSSTDRSKRLFVHYVMKRTHIDSNGFSASSSSTQAFKPLIIASLQHWLINTSNSETMLAMLHDLIGLGEEGENDDDADSSDELPLQDVKSRPNTRSSRLPTVADSTSDGSRVSSMCDKMFTQDSLLSALMLHTIGEMQSPVLFSLLCDAIEALPPIPCRRDDGNSTGYMEIHITLWRSLANLLGPINISSQTRPNRTLSISKTSELAKHITSLDALKGLTHRDMMLQVNSDSATDTKHPVVPGLYGANQMKISKFFEFPMIKAFKNKPYVYVPVPHGAGGAMGDVEEQSGDENGNGSSGQTYSQGIEEEVTSDTATVSESRSELAAMLSELRVKRRWWVTGGCIFSSHHMGEELSWNVLECTADVAVVDACDLYLNIVSVHSSSRGWECMLDVGVDYEEVSAMIRLRKQEMAGAADGEATNGGGGGGGDGWSGIAVKIEEDSEDEESHSTAHSTAITASPSSLSADVTGTAVAGSGGHSESGWESRERDVWALLLDWCEFGDSCVTYGQIKNRASDITKSIKGYKNEKCEDDDAIGPSICRFSVKKLEAPVGSTSEFWKNWPKIVTRVDSVARDVSTERSVVHALGGGILEILTFQVVVHCHINGEQDSVFVGRVAQVLVQHAMWEPLRAHRDIALKCIAYLTHMNVDISRAVRVANLLQARGVQFRVSPMEVIPLPFEEQVLHCSRGAVAYDGI
jgi:hypothetical protein